MFQCADHFYHEGFECVKFEHNFHKGFAGDFENSRGLPCQFSLDDHLKDVYSRQV